MCDFPPICHLFSHVLGSMQWQACAGGPVSISYKLFLATLMWFPGPLELYAGSWHLSWGSKDSAGYFLIPETQSQHPCFLFPFMGLHPDPRIQVWFLVFLQGSAGLAEALLAASVLSGQRLRWVTASATSQSKCLELQCHVWCQG